MTGKVKLPLKKTRQTCSLGEKIDTMVQGYLKKVREAGGEVSSRMVIGAACGILKILNKTRLKEFGGYIGTGHSKHMRFVQRRATTSKSKQSVETFTPMKILMIYGNGRDTTSINIQLGPCRDKTCTINIMDNGRKRIKECGDYQFEQ